MDIFSFFRSSEKKSKDIAKDRLKLVLIHDRGDFPVEKKNAIIKELSEVLSKYIEIDENGIEISIVDKKTNGDNIRPHFVANVPIIKMFHSN